MAQDKELIWVTKDQAEFFKSLEDDFKKADFIQSLIEKTKKQMQNDIENLDEELLEFKSFVIRYSRAFKEAYDAQAINVEKLWEVSTEPVDNIRKQLNLIKSDIKETSKQVEELTSAIGNINTYKIERMIELLNQFKSMSSSDKDIMKVLFETQKVNE